MNIDNNRLAYKYSTVGGGYVLEHVEHKNNFGTTVFVNQFDRLSLYSQVDQILSTHYSCFDWSKYDAFKGLDASMLFWSIEERNDMFFKRSTADIFRLNISLSTMDEPNLAIRKLTFFGPVEVTNYQSGRVAIYGE